MLTRRPAALPPADLAAHCRLLLHDRPRHTLFYRWAVLYPLYALSEIAIVSTDLAELLGSAMALSMLFPKLEVWVGVLITTADVLFLLAMRNPIGGHPVRAFELRLAALVSSEPLWSWLRAPRVRSRSRTTTTRALRLDAGCRLRSQYATPPPGAATDRTLILATESARALPTEWAPFILLTYD